MLKRNLLRDILFYVVSLSVLIVAALVGELSVYFGITFLVIYVCFVTLVVVMDKIEARNKEKRKEIRKTLMDKRSTMGSVTAKEQAILDDADLDEDAFYYVDENDHLVDIEIEKPEEDEEDDEDRFKRAFTDKTDHEIENIGNEEVKAEKSKENKRNFLSPKSNNLKIQDNESSIAETSLEESLIPKIKSLETQKETNLQSSKEIVDLTDLIEKTKIEQGKNLTSFIIEDHYEETPLVRASNKGLIIQKTNTRLFVSKTKHKIVWSMLKMK